MNSRICVTSLLFLLLGSLAAWADYYEFEDAQGRKMRAKPLRMVGSQVEIQREDGQRFRVSPSIFTAEGREHLASWQRAEALKRDSTININAVSSTSRKVRDNSSAGLVIDRYNGFYRVRINNNSDVAFTDLVADYRYFVFKNEIAGQRRGDGKTLRVAGTHKIDRLAARSEVEFETEQTEMVDTSLKSGYYWVGGGKGKSSDSLNGVWVRLYKGKDLIAEYVYPTVLSQREDW